MKDPKNVRKNLLTVLAVLCALALGIAVGALLLPKDAHLPPDRAPEQDPNAVPYEEDEVTRIIQDDVNEKIYGEIKGWTVAELREWLLD